MNKITMKRVVEINCKNINSYCSEKTNETYQNFIDLLDTRYNIDLLVKLSEVNTPIIIIRDKRHKNLFATVYCFDNMYYFNNYKDTFISSKLEEIFNRIDLFFSE